jgi:hypothetical protein
MLCFGEDDSELIAQQTHVLPDPGLRPSVLKRPIRALIEEIRNNAQFHFFVHPAPPIPRAVAPAICQLNAVLQDAVAELRSAGNAVEFVNIVPALLDEDKAAMKPEYAPDGVHLGPAYLPVLEACLNECAENREKPPMRFFALDVE